MPIPQKITPCLWFDDRAEEAVAHYVSIFPGSKVLEVSRYTEAGPGEPGTVVTIEFELAGQRFQAVNGGPEFQFTEAISLSVACETQAELDALWERLTEGGQAVQCGWLKDKFGLSWQIVPTALPKLMAHPDRGVVRRVTEAMLGMVKLDIAKLEAAAKGA